jgi:hypothetical protein
MKGLSRNPIPFAPPTTPDPQVLEFFFGVKLHQILTWKLWFRPLQMIFHSKSQIRQISQKKVSRSPDFYDNFQ